MHLPGKCQQIHGHSMRVTLGIDADKDTNGYALGPDGTPLDFGGLKKTFRGYLDEVWDHHLHLNQADPWAKPLTPRALYEDGMPRFEHLPGLQIWPADPSVENIAQWIKNHMELELPDMSIYVDVEETATNGAGV